MIRCKPVIILIFIGILLCSCVPSQQTIQKAIEQTQTVSVLFPTQTPYPTYTPNPTVIRIIVQTPTPEFSDSLCRPIENMTYENMWKSITMLQSYVDQFPDVKVTTLAVPENLYSNAVSHIVHIDYISKDDGKEYSRRYIIYFKEFAWKNAVYSIDGQCFIDPPH